MNLHNIVAGAISAINPQIAVSYKQSTGYTTNSDGSRAPSYAQPIIVQAQKQPLSYRDTVQISGVNIAGEKAAFYITGNWQPVSRSITQGGDLLTMPTGDVWLVVMLLENFSETSGWTKVAAVLQNNL